MSSGKKILFLVLALALPVFVFLFLKFFGKNEFNVAPLYETTLPEVPAGCRVPTLPYHITDSVLNQIEFDSDSIALVLFGENTGETARQLARVDEAFTDHPSFLKAVLPLNDRTSRWMQCVFFLKEPLNLVLVDKRGVIRGQFASDDREEIDRLLMEITIILKRY